MLETAVTIGTATMHIFTFSFQDENVPEWYLEPSFSDRPSIHFLQRQFNEESVVFQMMASQGNAKVNKRMEQHVPPSYRKPNRYDPP